MTPNVIQPRERLYYRSDERRIRPHPGSTSRRSQRCRHPFRLRSRARTIAPPHICGGFGDRQRRPLSLILPEEVRQERRLMPCPTCRTARFHIPVAQARDSLDHPLAGRPADLHHSRHDLRPALLMSTSARLSLVPEHDPRAIGESCVPGDSDEAINPCGRQLSCGDRACCLSSHFTCPRPERRTRASASSTKARSRSRSRTTSRTAGRHGAISSTSRTSASASN